MNTEINDISSDENEHPTNDDIMEDTHQYDIFSDDDILSKRFSPRNIHWSISWSDLMMTMFILFVVMYIYSASNRELDFGEGFGREQVSDIGSGGVSKSRGGYKDLNPGDERTISAIYDISKQIFRNELLEDEVDIDLVSDQAVKIMLTGDLLFDPGKFEIKSEAKEILYNIASVLEETPYVINVAGHTDNVPNHSDNLPTNWELSAFRACIVARFLIEQMGIRSERFFVTGHSYHQPVLPNSNSKNRAFNRRVEIIIMKERPYATEP